MKLNGPCYLLWRRLTSEAAPNSWLKLWEFANSEGSNRGKLRSPPAMSTTSTTAESSKRHAATPLDKQRAQLEKLLKDPSKPAYIPPPPKEKTVRPAREMMKNVQGSSAGAGSGEFHVYKASRRREYERLKLMEDEAEKARRMWFIVLSSYTHLAPGSRSTRIRAAETRTRASAWSENGEESCQEAEEEGKG